MKARPSWTLVTLCLAGLLLAALPVLAQTAVTPPGTGTVDDPYRISELGHLVWMGDSAGTGAGKCYALQNDINASATAQWNDVGTDASVLEGFKPIGTDWPYFDGTFDGQDHVVRGLTVNRPQMYKVGLFSQVDTGGVVRRLGLEGGSLTGDFPVGGLVGDNDGTVQRCYATGAVTGDFSVGGLVGDNADGTVTQCYATGTVTGERDRTGGLVGDNADGTVTQCYATGTVTADSFVGGLVGDNAHGTVTQCYATGAVLADRTVGGLAGDNAGTVEQCYATGTVTGADHHVGGLVGFNSYGTVTQCYATGAVTGCNTVGGLVGNNSFGAVTQCYATGTVTGEDYYVGGLVGGSSGTVAECYATGTVSGGAGVGGLVGDSAFGAVTQCYATGTASGESGVGGLAGTIYGTVTQCYATGGVTGAEDVGGLVGDSCFGTVTQCYATGAVTGEDYHVGGLVGSNFGTVGQCYATGTVTGDQYIGGLVGENYGTVLHCYATGTMAGWLDIGGLAGGNYGTVEHCYWDTETSGWPTSAGGEGRTTAQMRQQSTYSGWDFASVWDLAAERNHGCPYLRGLPWLARCLALVGGAEVDQGRGLWGVTGAYSATVAGYPLMLNLAHESNGRLIGTAEIAGIAVRGKAVTTVPLRVKGCVKGTGRAVLVYLTLQGAGSATRVRVALSLALSVDADARQLRGPVLGSIRTAAGTVPIADSLTLDLPAAMDGSWTLLCDLAVNETACSGTALVTLSNGVDLLFAATGSPSGQALVLILSGDPVDPAAKGIRIKTTITPLEGGWGRIESFSGRGYGQAVRW